MTWLVVCTVTAGVQKVFSTDPAIGFLSHAAKFCGAVAENRVLAPARSLNEMNRVIFNDYVDATLAGVFAVIVVTMVVYGVLACCKAMGTPRSTAIETGGGAPIMVAGNDQSPVGVRDGHADRSPDSRRAGLSDLCRAPAHHASRQAGDDIPGVLPRASGRAVFRHQGPLQGCC
jgi:hypothetical protein